MNIQTNSVESTENINQTVDDINTDNTAQVNSIKSKLIEKIFAGKITKKNILM
jgi:hypothetical protein